jgi:hypothetical protein
VALENLVKIRADLFNYLRIKLLLTRPGVCPALVIEEYLFDEVNRLAALSLKSRLAHFIAAGVVAFLSPAKKAP